MRPVTVVGLNRYAVKSTLGESPAELVLDDRGVVGDRLWSVRTEADKIGSGKNSNRFAEVLGLLSIRSRRHDGGTVTVFWDGLEAPLPIEDPATAMALSERLAMPLTVAQESDVSHYDDGPVSLVGMASIDAVAAERGAPIDPARFRANLLLSTTVAYVEQEWIGRTVRVGSAVLVPQLVLPRCVMVNMETAELPAQPGNVAALGRANDGRLGIVARVAQPGVIRVGDEVSVD